VIKKILIGLVLLAAVVFLFSRLADLASIVDVFARGNLWYLGLALLVQCAWIYNLGVYYQEIYLVLGMTETRLHMILLTSAGNFLSVLAPSGGLSALAIYLADGQRKGRSPAKVMVAGALYVWLEYLGTLLVATLGLAALAQRNSLHWAEIAASLVLLAGALGMALLFYLGFKSTALLDRTLTWLARLVNRLLHPFIHRDYLHEERAHTFSSELAEGIAALRQNKRWAVRPLTCALTNKALLWLVMRLCFLAFDVPVDAGTVVAGLGLAQLFLIVSPTPAGVGIVEGVLAVALRSLHVAGENAAAITLAYRGFDFWLPFLFGVITFRLLTHREKPALPQEVMEEA
jgi:glycosyltransferase 2 family protein